jgi:hypothetical protein
MRESTTADKIFKLLSEEALSMTSNSKSSKVCARQQSRKGCKKSAALKVTVTTPSFRVGILIEGAVITRFIWLVV